HGLSRGAFASVTKPTTTEGLEAAAARIKEYAMPRRKRLLAAGDHPAAQPDPRAPLGHDHPPIEVVGAGAAARPPLHAPPVGDLPLEKQQMLDRLHRSDDALFGKKVLVVDDDVRNIFALSSVLERRGMTVLTAGTGREAIATLDSTPDLAIVLMDIMMPEMDGYETMQVIRQNPAFQRLPIIALTAKAMKGDREKCLEAGASDYLAKPVNTEQLLSALRMWLHR